MLLQQLQNYHNLALYSLSINTSLLLGSLLGLFLTISFALAFILTSLSNRKEKNEIILRNRYLTALVKVQFELLTSFDHFQDYEKVISILGDAAKANRAYLWVNSSGKESLPTNYQSEWYSGNISIEDNYNSQDVYEKLSVSRNKFFTKGKYLHELVTDLTEQEKDLFTARDSLAILVFPLVINNQLWGLMGFENSRENKLWNYPEIKWLNSAINSITSTQIAHIRQKELQKLNTELEKRARERNAKIIEANEKLFNELNQRKQIQENLIESQLSLTVINKISTGIIANLPIEKILAETFQRLGKYYFDISMVYAISNGEGEVEVKYNHNSYESEIQLIGKKFQFNVVPNCLKTLSKGSMIIANDTSEEQQLSPLLPQLSANKIKGWLVAPLHNSKTFFGLIYFYTPEPRNWSYYEISTLKDAAKYLSIALKNYQTEIELQEYRNNLQQLVQERTQSLVKTNQKLQKEINERLQVEEALRSSEDRFRVTFNQAAVGIVQTDLEGNFLKVNQKFCQIIGYSNAEMLKLNAFALTYSEDYQSFSQSFTQLLAGDIPTFSLEERFVCKEGSPVWINITTSLVYLPNGSPHYAIGIIEDISDRKQAEEKIQNSLREKEILLKEIHHRVKNNLHIISSLLDLQSDYLEDERFSSVFTDSQSRIETMALVHEQLYKSEDLRQVDLGDYIHRLMDNLAISYNCDLSIIFLNVEVEPVILNLETAIPCGLLINELVTNCFKHAFPQGRSGEIHIELEQNTEKRIRLTVWDNGVGIPSNVDWQNSNSLGLELIHTLAQQLHAEIILDRDHGTSFTFRFFQLNYKDRF